MFWWRLLCPAFVGAGSLREEGFGGCPMHGEWHQRKAIWWGLWAQVQFHNFAATASVPTSPRAQTAMKLIYWSFLCYGR